MKKRKTSTGGAGRRRAGRGGEGRAPREALSGPAAGWRGRWWWTTAWFASLCLLAPRLAAAEPVVSKVRVEHRMENWTLEIRYDLAAVEEAPVWVEASLALGPGRQFQVLTNGLGGDAGLVVRPGPGKRLEWRHPADWIGRRFTGVLVRVTARPFSPTGMVWIRPGTFRMGSPESESWRDPDEGPLTEVRLTRGYWLGKHEVTQEGWEAVMGSNPSRFRGSPDLPVEQVSWADTMAYCRKVTERERAAERLPPGYEYRLPTEAEWEYACRAGTTTATAFGDRLNSSQANIDDKVGQTVRVGSYAANGWGLCDMHGNVWEWCLDWYANRLPGDTVTDLSGPTAGTDRVIRGGGWDGKAWIFRSANRSGYSPSRRYSDLGFRLACGPVRE